MCLSISLTKSFFKSRPRTRAKAWSQLTIKLIGKNEFDQIAKVLDNYNAWYTYVTVNTFSLRHFFPRALEIDNVNGRRERERTRRRARPSVRFWVYSGFYTMVPISSENQFDMILKSSLHTAKEGTRWQRSRSTIECRSLCIVHLSPTFFHIYYIWDSE